MFDEQSGATFITTLTNPPPLKPGRIPGGFAFTSLTTSTRALLGPFVVSEEA